MSKNTLLFDERVSRVKAAVSLKEHDRVPIMGNFGFWPVRYHNKYTMQEAYYNIDAMTESYTAVLDRWGDWDVLSNSVSARGPALDAMGSKRFAIPGRQISPHSDPQHPDWTLMEPNEYDMLIANPLRFQLDTVLPRICARVSGGSVYEIMKAMAKVFVYNQTLRHKTGQFWADCARKYSISVLQQSTFIVPVDLIADGLRGFGKGLVDVKIRQAKVIEASEALLPLLLNSLLSAAPAGSDFPFIYNPQHVSPFISPKDYEKVYWPFYKKMVDVLTARGNTVWTVFEGAQDQHLEYFQELPHGRFVAHFEGTDLAKAKKYLGGKICIAGGMPTTLLAKGTPAEVEDQAESVLKLFAGEPGFIMCTDGGLNSAKPENIQAWLCAMQKYGQLGGKLDIIRPGEESVQAKDTTIDLDSLIVPFDQVREDFGEIKGDEAIIRRSWEQLEKSVLGLLSSFSM